MIDTDTILKDLNSRFEILAVINLDPWYDQKFFSREQWLEKQLTPLYRDSFENDQRLVFTLTRPLDPIADSFQKLLNKIDISNYFVILLTNDIDNIERKKAHLSTLSQDAVRIEILGYDTPAVIPYSEPSTYSYDSPDPVKVSFSDLNQRHQHLLKDSKVFCIYPWIHLHAFPTGEAWPCCHADMAGGTLGNCQQQSMKEIWNGAQMKQLRRDLLSETPNQTCIRCYEKEESGAFSGRRSANKHHGHHISRVDHTQPDGHLESFQMTYWDIRFSNLCNLRCRSCGHIFSSQWYQDQVKLAGPTWAASNKVLNYAGRHKTDAWEQLLEHIDYVEQIYFAGGEPLIMDEHYKILDELEKRNKFDVRLIYNTNFTEVKLKDRLVFEYWKKFDSVSVGASLDAMGPRAEYIRKGTTWDDVVRNREKMMEICPQVDFYVSATLSILNAWHLPDFHRDWVDRGLIRASDFNINLLQDPPHYRIDIAPMKYKQRLRIKFEEHIEWLAPHDRLRRASNGYQSAINFMMADDKQHLLEKFWEKTKQLDSIRDENIIGILPELQAIQ